MIYNGFYKTSKSTGHGMFHMYLGMWLSCVIPKGVSFLHVVIQLIDTDGQIPFLLLWHPSLVPMFSHVLTWMRKVCFFWLNAGLCWIGMFGKWVTNNTGVWPIMYLLYSTPGRRLHDVQITWQCCNIIHGICIFWAKSGLHNTLLLGVHEVMTAFH